MPFLDRETTAKEAEGKKYVWVFDKIYFSDPFDGNQITHGDLVKRVAQELNISLSDVPRDDRGKPMVQAAGRIEVVN